MTSFGDSPTYDPADGSPMAVRVVNRDGSPLAASGGGGTSSTDDAPFTPGVSSVTPIGGLADEASPDAVDEGDVGVVRMTLTRALHVNLRDASGNEVSLGAGTQYNEDAASAGGEKVTLAGAVRRDTAASSSGADGDYSTLNTDANGRLWVNASGAAVPVTDNAGSLTVDNAGTFAVQATEADGANVTLGAKADAKSTATDSTAISVMSVLKQISASVQAAASSLAGTLTVAAHAVTQSGTWTVQPGNTANTVAWKVDGSAVTQPVSNTGLTALNGAIAGTEVQVDVVGALPAGTNAIGKLAANSGVDIGDVDVTTLTPGVGATNLGKAEDAAHASGDVGVMALVVRQDSQVDLGADGDYVPMTVDADGGLRVSVIAGGGGGGSSTQYDEDTASADAQKLMMAGVTRADTATSQVGTDGDRSTLIVDASGRLHTNVGASALPTGAATAAKQPALGTAGSSSTDVLSVQGIASGTALPVSIASVPSHAVTNAGTFAVQADTELTTADLDTGAGTDTRAVVGLALAASGGAVLAGTANPVPISDNGGSVTVDGTVAATQSGTWNVGTVTTITNAVHVDDNSGSLTVDDGGSSLTVDGTVAATQSGAWNVTNVSGTVSLPTGAATAAKQPALGTAGSASADVLSVQGVTSMTPLLVNASGNAVPVTDNGGSITVDGTFWQATQPISGTVTVSSAPSTAVTNAGTFAVQAAEADGANVTLGAKADAKSTATDTTAITIMSVLKQVSFSIQAAAASLAGTLTVAAHNVTNAGTFAVQAAQSGTWTVQPGNTANTTAWKVDASSVAVPITDNSGSLTVDAPVGTPAFVRLSDGAAAITTLPVSLASVPSHAITNAGTFVVQENGAALTALQLIDDPVATAGAAITAKGMAAAGTDGTNARILKTDSSGELQVDVLTLPALIASSARIGKTTVRNAADNADIDPLAESTFTGRFPSAATAADGTTLPSTTVERAVQMHYNGTNLDLQRGNENRTILASAARTANTSSSAQTNYNHRGVLVVVAVTAGTGFNITPSITITDPVSGFGITIHPVFTAITTTGVYAYSLYPGATPGAAIGQITQTYSIPLPRTWGVTVGHGNANSVTYSVSASLIL